MQLKKILIFIPIMLILCDPQGCSASENRETSDRFIPGSCTIFAVSFGGSVFFGNNEDWINPLTYCWVEPPGTDKYGVLCFGFDNLYPQGGINEKGLAFDANALPVITMKKNQDGIKPYHAIVNTILMQKCATVSEAIETAKRYDWSQCYGGKLDGQFLLADALGDAVVISADTSGELVFTRKVEGNGYLVSTNFNRACPENRYGRYPCNRYDTTVKMLKAIDSDRDLTLDYLASILNAVHVEGRKLNTLYSNIFDLKNGVAYLYFWHQFDSPVTFDVPETIARGLEPTQIKTLFPAGIVDQAAAEFRSYKRKRIFILAGWVVLLISIAAFIIVRKLRRDHKTG